MQIPSSPRARRLLLLALLGGSALVLGVLTIRGGRVLEPWAAGRPELYFRSSSGEPVPLDALPKR